MEMKISNDRKLKNLQEEFNSHFPFLRIEFFSRPHVSDIASADNEILNPDLTVGELCPLSSIGYLPLDGNQKVG
ncbi:MAG: hypothetical protein ACI81W_003639, partial [Saprospiraceae bacterium]